MSTAIQVNIKRQLAEQNMSAAELERRTGIPHAVVNILHGRSKNPSLRTAQAIAKELGCSVEDLLSDQKVTRDVQQTNTTWNPSLYKASFDAIYAEAIRLALDPTPQFLAECITEVYLYTLGSPNQAVDKRFVNWLLNKNSISQDNSQA